MIVFYLQIWVGVLLGFGGMLISIQNVIERSSIMTTSFFFFLHNAPNNQMEQ